jgi:hypothetical protein
MKYFEENDKLVKSLKGRIIRFLGLKGSWTWAKKMMMKGYVVRCRHWSGALQLRIDSAENGLLQSSHHTPKPKWETSFHHLSYEDFVDYEIVPGIESIRSAQDQSFYK